MNLIEKIESQTEKFLELRQELDGIIEALNELPAWAQSIDDAKARAKEVQRKFNYYHKANQFPHVFLLGDTLEELCDENEEVLDELEEIKNYLSSWLDADDFEHEDVNEELYIPISPTSILNDTPQLRTPQYIKISPY
jgi:chaperonin cofactor prefoldin